MRGETEMKKIFVFLLAFAMVVSFAACGTNEEKSFATVNAKDCFRDAGYIQLFKGGAAESTEKLPLNEELLLPKKSKA